MLFCTAVTSPLCDAHDRLSSCRAPNQHCTGNKLCLFFLDAAGLCHRSSLQSVGLVGPLPEALGGLRRLEVLNLESNQLTGTLPAAWGSTNTLSRLQQLLLSGNRINGELPREWGRPSRWPALASLQLGANNISGGTPASWAGTGQCSEAHPFNLQDLLAMYDLLTGAREPINS